MMQDGHWEVPPARSWVWARRTAVVESKMKTRPFTTPFEASTSVGTGFTIGSCPCVMTFAERLARDILDVDPGLLPENRREVSFVALG